MLHKVIKAERCGPWASCFFFFLRFSCSIAYGGAWDNIHKTFKHSILAILIFQMKKEDFLALLTIGQKALLITMPVSVCFSVRLCVNLGVAQNVIRGHRNF